MPEEPQHSLPVRLYVDGEPADQVPDDNQWHQVAIIDANDQANIDVRADGV